MELRSQNKMDFQEVQRQGYATNNPGLKNKWGKQSLFLSLCLTEQDQNLRKPTHDDEQEKESDWYGRFRNYHPVYWYDVDVKRVQYHHPFHDDGVVSSHG